MKTGYLKKDRMERYNSKRGWFVNAWRIVDEQGADLVQPWPNTKSEARRLAVQLGIGLKGEFQVKPSERPIMKLEGIKPGDVLAIDKTYSSGVDLHVVERLTNTQAVTVKGIRVALKDGKVICSSGYSVRYARIPTDKDILEHRIDVATGGLRNFFVTADSIEAFLKGQS